MMWSEIATSLRSSQWRAGCVTFSPRIDMWGAWDDCFCGCPSRHCEARRAVAICFTDVSLRSTWQCVVLSCTLTKYMFGWFLVLRDRYLGNLQCFAITKYMIRLDCVLRDIYGKVMMWSEIATSLRSSQWCDGVFRFLLAMTVGVFHCFCFTDISVRHARLTW